MSTTSPLREHLPSTAPFTINVGRTTAAEVLRYLDQAGGYVRDGEGVACLLFEDASLGAPFLRVGRRGSVGLLAWYENGREIYPAGGTDEYSLVQYRSPSGTLLPQPARSETAWSNVVVAVQEFSVTGQHPTCVRWDDDASARAGADGTAPSDGVRGPDNDCSRGAESRTWAPGAVSPIPRGSSAAAAVGVSDPGIRSSVTIARAVIPGAQQ